MRSRQTRASSHDHWTNAGVLAARSWLAARGAATTGTDRWHAEIVLDVVDRPPPARFDIDRDTRFRIEIYSEEWGYFCCHRGQASWIRVTDIPFVHGRDDFRFLDVTPALKDLSTVVRAFEKRNTVKLRREHALVRTNLPNAEPAIRRWVQSL